MIYFTSDLHFHHKNIIKSLTKWDKNTPCLRDFSSIEEMNFTLINNINQTIKNHQEDVLFILGDFSFSRKEKDLIEIRNQILCKNIYFVVGNHDWQFESPVIRELFTKVSTFNQLILYKDYTFDLYDIPCYLKKYTEKEVLSKIELFHYPINVDIYSEYKYLHLHGHLHTTLSLQEQLNSKYNNVLDIGIDSHPDLKPYSIEEILLTKKENFYNMYKAGKCTLDDSDDYVDTWHDSKEIIVPLEKYLGFPTRKEYELYLKGLDF
jgi:calcineurin-like phosphoesterase family protein